MSASENRTLKEKTYVPLSYITCVFYVVALVLKIWDYIDLLKLYKYGLKLEDGVFDLYAFTNMDKIAPDLPTVIANTAWLAAFISLGICVAAIFCKRLKKAADVIFSVYTFLLFVYVLLVFASLFVRGSSPEFGFLHIVLLIAAAVMLFIGLKKYKTKVGAVMIAAIAVMTIVECIFIEFEGGSFVPDAILLALLFVLDYLGSRSDRTAEQ